MTAAETADGKGPNRGGGEEHSLTEVVERLKTAGEDRETSVNDVLSTFEDRSAGVLITVFGFIAAVPVIGAIPGVSILTATLILVTVVQAMRGRSGALRLPGAIGRRTIERERFKRGVERGRRWAERVDRLLGERLTFLTRGRPQRALILIAVTVLALAMYPLAFVPWGVTAPSVGVVAFGLALIARDGLLALIGYLLCGATAATFYWGSTYLVHFTGAA